MEYGREDDRELNTIAFYAGQISAINIVLRG